MLPMLKYLCDPGHDGLVLTKPPRRSARASSPASFWACPHHNTARRSTHGEGRKECPAHLDLIASVHPFLVKDCETSGEDRYREAGIHRTLNADVAVVGESTCSPNAVLDEDTEEFCRSLAKIPLDISPDVDDECRMSQQRIVQPTGGLQSIGSVTHGV